MGSYVSPALSYLQDIREPWRRFEITYILGDAARRGVALTCIRTKDLGV